MTIALNATTDCSAQGAICTEDGGKLSSGLLLAVPGPNSPATGLPTITGTAQVGETLTADTTGISDDDGLGNATFAYQWFAADAEINGATASTYTLVAADAGKAIKVRVSFTDDAGNDEQLTSAATGAVATAPPPPNNPATGAPTITGAAQVGETLTADTTGISDGDGLNNATFAYQWLTDDAEINGATASTYTLVAADAGKAIRVRVSFTDDAGNDEQLTSAVTAAVVKPPLTATVHDVPSSHNGQDAFIFELRFSESPKPDFSYRTVWDHAFTVTGGSVTYVRRLEPGQEHPLGDHCHPRIQRRRGHSPERHHGLRGRRRHLHRGRQEAVRRAGAHRHRARPVAGSKKKHASMNGRGRRSDRDPDLPRYEQYGKGSLRPHSRGPTAELWERLCYASTAHTLQQNHLRLPRLLPAALEQF